VSRPPALQTVGVDEWAWRRRHRYGTILVDLATHRVVDLLPDRSAASVAAWLAQHPTITVVCRDRRDLYADGIRRGAPEAVQVVDRFHLVHNLRQALEAFLIDRRPALQAAAVGTTMVLIQAMVLSPSCLCTGDGARAPNPRSLPPRCALCRPGHFATDGTFLDITGDSHRTEVGSGQPAPLQ
jgi:hypothetical protein